MNRTSLLCLTALLAACGGSSKPATPPPAPVVWKDMNHDQQMAYMKDVVLPKTKAIFVAFDPQFKDMNCETCHGDGVKDGKYKLPNPKIHVLPGSEEAYMAWIGKDAEAARYTKFMAGELEPLMGELLHKTVFDPKTNQGEFGCPACHMLEGARTATPE